VCVISIKKMIAQLSVEIAHISTKTIGSHDYINIYTQEKFIESYVLIRSKIESPIHRANILKIRSDISNNTIFMEAQSFP